MPDKNFPELTSAKATKPAVTSAKGKGLKAQASPALNVLEPVTAVETDRVANTPAIEAKTRFNAALEEAKAGAAALRAEAETRLSTAGQQAKGKGSDLVSEAKVYGEQALGKAGDLAVEGKKTASDAIASLGKVVGDSASQIDEKLGEQYGDYARKASRTLVETSAKLDAKSVEELGEDARAAVRKSPGVAVGIAAVVGFFLARLLGGKRS